MILRGLSAWDPHIYLQQAVERSLMFAPDPASYRTVLSAQHRGDAGGMRTPKYGVTKHHVLGSKS